MPSSTMPPVVTTAAATPPAVPPATPATPGVQQHVWMSQSDWHKVVTRRELKAELKLESLPKKKNDSNATRFFLDL